MFKAIIIVCKTRCDLSLSRYFDQDSVGKGILQIISGPVSKIIIVSKSYWQSVTFSCEIGSY